MIDPAGRAKEDRSVSLNTVVNGGLVGRVHLRRAPVGAATVSRPRVNETAVRLTGASMWVLETGIVFAALATALLIGLAR
jgi:hypothetical protein